MPLKAFCLLIVFSPLLSSGCRDENFDPKGDIKEKYILNCILRSDTTVQTATLSESYNVQGYDPMENRTDPAVEHADIRVWVGDSVYVFKEAEMPRSDTSRYSTRIKYYYAENFRPQADKPAEILAVLPNGRKLHASTTTPLEVQTDYAETDSLVPVQGRDYIYAAWISYSSPTTYFYPRFSLVYFKIVNGLPVRFSKFIPARYTFSGGKEVPVYPLPATGVKYSIDMDALRRTMQDISAGDPDKSKYVILAIVADVMALDMNLSGFYSSGKLLSDGFSVKVDETDFTNIEGGLGIFGAYVNHELAIRIDKKYIRSFGYKTTLVDE